MRLMLGRRTAAAASTAWGGGRRLLGGEAGTAGGGKSWTADEEEPARKWPRFTDWVRTPIGVFTVLTAGAGSVAVGSWGMRQYRKLTSMYAENKLVQTLQEEGSEQAYYRYLYAALARQVLRQRPIAEHMGDLRFSPDTMKPFQFPKDNQMAVIFNVYGTRRVGLVYCLLEKGVNAEGLPLYTPVEFTVDSWDGHVFKVPLGEKLDFSICMAEVVRQKNSKREARLLKGVSGVNAVD